VGSLFTPSCFPLSVNNNRLKILPFHQMSFVTFGPQVFLNYSLLWPSVRTILFWPRPWIFLLAQTIPDFSHSPPPPRLQAPTRGQEPTFVFPSQESTFPCFTNKVTPLYDVHDCFLGPLWSAPGFTRLVFTVTSSLRSLPWTSFSSQTNLAGGPFFLDLELQPGNFG